MATEFEPTDHLTVKRVRRADRFSQFAMVASDEALAEGRLEGRVPYDVRPDRLPDRHRHRRHRHARGNHKPMLEKAEGGLAALDPLMMGNAASAAVSMRHGLRGQSFATLSACAAGAHAIGTAAA